MRNKKIERTRVPVVGYQRPAGANWLDEHAEQLPINQWSAADDNGLLGSAPDQEQLEKIIDQKTQQGLVHGAVVIHFHTSDSAG